MGDRTKDDEGYEIDENNIHCGKGSSQTSEAWADSSHNERLSCDMFFLRQTWTLKPSDTRVPICKRIPLEP